MSPLAQSPNPSRKPQGPISRIQLSSIKQVAARLSISTWTVRELIWSGEMPHVRIGKRILLDDRDVDHYIEDMKQPAA